MKKSLGHQLDREKQKITARLAPLIGGKEPKQPGAPEFNAPRAKYELAARVRAVSCGGLPVLHDLVRSVGLPESIDKELGILKRARQPFQRVSSVVPSAPYRTLSHPSWRHGTSTMSIGPRSWH
ncbi:MAG: hypothetical protein WCJ30_19040 [Deltaproteobacteria bacterium]